MLVPLILAPRDQSLCGGGLEKVCQLLKSFGQPLMRSRRPKLAPMAWEITVRQLSGKPEVLKVVPDWTVRDFKRQLKEIPCEDEVIQRLRDVDVVLGDLKLPDDETLLEAGVSPEAEVQVVFNMQPVECASQTEAKEAGFFRSSLLVVHVPDRSCLEDFAFHGCRSLLKVSLPSSLRDLGKCSFTGCSSLKRVVLPDLVAHIGKAAFKNCSSLEEVIIPPAVSCIYNETFQNCSSMKHISLPSVVHLGRAAFQDCSSLREVHMPLVTQIYNDTFRGCRALLHVSIPKVTYIGQGAFLGSGLRSVDLLRISTIGLAAFAGCSLCDLELPDEVTHVGARAFKGCTKVWWLGTDLSADS